MMTKDQQIKYLKEIIDDTIHMAIRYAHGRHTGAPYKVRESVQRMKKYYPDWNLRADPVIEAPKPEDIGGFRLREDYLDDLFTNN